MRPKWIGLATRAHTTILPLGGPLWRMKCIQQILGWTSDTHLFELPEPIEFERGRTRYILHNYPSEFDLFSFASLIFPADKEGNLLDFGDMKDRQLSRKIADTICDYFRACED
jgi:hypothetical protein